MASIIARTRLVHVLGFLLSIFIATVLFSQARYINAPDRIRKDQVTGVPRAIYNINSPEYTGTPRQIATAFLQDYAVDFQMHSDLSDLEITEVKTSPAGHHVVFEQQVGDIPVLHANTVVSVNRANQVSMVINNYNSGISVNEIPALSASAATTVARQSLGSTSPEKHNSPKSRLAIYRDSTRAFHLVYEVFIFCTNPFEEWIILVDAHSGEILQQVETGLSYVNGTGRVFDPDPVNVRAT